MINDADKMKSNDAILFACEDELELRYKLNSNRDAEVLRSRAPSLADGRLHAVAVRRESDSVSIQVIALQSGAVSSTVAVETFLSGPMDLIAASLP